MRKINQIEELIKNVIETTQTYNRILEQLQAENSLRQSLFDFQAEFLKRLKIKSAAETVFMLIAILIILGHLCGQ